MKLCNCRNSITGTLEPNTFKIFSANVCTITNKKPFPEDDCPRLARILVPKGTFLIGNHAYWGIALELKPMKLATSNFKVPFFR